MSVPEVPTPSPIPSPLDGPYSLSERINIATRPTHSLLNRSILARLPLALPPHTTNPSLYVSGILHIAPIYITFESLWQSILDAPHLPTCSSDDDAAESCRDTADSCVDACDPESPLLDSKSLPLVSNLADSPTMVHSPKICSRTHSILSYLHLPGLLRGGRLLADIRRLTGAPEHQIEQQIASISDNGRLAAFIAHTKHSVEKNPHVLLAYAWVLYMAIFSGGRYIRASLMAASGPDGKFWEREPSPVRPYDAITSISDNKRRSGSKSEMVDSPELRRSVRSRSRSETHTTTRSGSGNNIISCLEFFNFLGEEDGEDIKREFKKRMTETEMLLTPGEKEDVVIEAQDIFSFMIEMVAELDTVCAANIGAIPGAATGREDHRPLVESRDSVAITQKRLFKQKLDSRRLSETRDSVQVTQDRLSKKKQGSQDDQEDKADEEGLQSDLDRLLGKASPKLVHFEDAISKSRPDFLSGLVSIVTKPLGRRFWREGCAHQKPEAASLDWATIFVTTITTSILFVVFIAWYSDYGLTLQC